jgi:cyclopropane fatty-acyl-phospholipid synthase-like methyltransferase
MDTRERSTRREAPSDRRSSRRRLAELLAHADIAIHNFDQNWPRLRDSYGERFYRMWRFYLLTCAGTFRARTNHLWQFVLSKQGIVGGYEAVR